MIDFRNIELDDKEWIDKCMSASDFQGCEYVFSSAFIWRKIYHTQVANVEGMCCIKSGTGENVRYNYPAGTGDTKKVIELLMEDAKECGHRFVLRGITEDKISELEEWFPELLDFELVRDESDYVYTVEKLTHLAGKKLHGKRNHIHRFQDSGNWEYKNVTSENIDECRQMNQQWLEQYVTEEDVSLLEEADAVKEAMDHFEELGLTGGILRRDGKVVAYTLAEPLNSNTYVIHIEKAFYEIQGAYPMINQQFVTNNCQDYEYVNREEDTGDEGLRKAKLSYYPDILLDKYNATLKKGK